jgi:hypothetical protein
MPLPAKMPMGTNGAGVWLMRWVSLMLMPFERLIPKLC